ncbi:hypothetical protein EXIGLDRAFT_737188 [Exidia glandulosa HHB12029]|uniref:Uncharacterized protein n=1 Tax=Exidia glandulosa HHB12029 TaxID=1314781 RepID=A0A165J469_EXIGL|nr:hypothetical protein EXIGLDRAFT_737188 [Exidia glandulosa HHB12029]
MGMLMGDMSDSDDDDERIAHVPQKPAPAKQPSLRAPPGNNAYPPNGRPPPPGLNPPAPVMSPPPPGPIPSRGPANLATPQPARPRAAFMPPARPATAEPHPLQAPSTPIVAKFAVASRGPSEESFTKNRTTVFGDEFWMRFNKAAKEEKQSENNSFKREYVGGAGRLSKWVWCCSILLIICIAGGIGAGWYFTHNKPSGPPVAIGGSANENSLSPTVPSSTAEESTTRTRVRTTAAPTPTDTDDVPAVRRRSHRARR